MRFTAHQIHESARIDRQVRSCCAVMAERVKIPSEIGKYNGLRTGCLENLSHVNHSSN